MKRHRKLVAFIIALGFLFSIAAPVMAASPSGAQVSADKLNVLGIIEGYTDGSFGLEKNITRAEFAKIAVAAYGLTEAAEQLVNYPTDFTDVKIGEWYTGWINMAASQGFVNGYPNGEFRPNDNISYAEVVTVLVRMLGYNDNLVGNWPTNYLAKAVELDITKGIALKADSPATRGDVFIMTDNTLDCHLVTWSTDKLDWEWVKEKPKLITKSFKGVMHEGLVRDISWDSRGNIILSLIDEDGAKGSSKLSPNVIVTGTKDAYGLLGKQVEYIKNIKKSGPDKDDIVYLGLKDTISVSKDKAEFEGRYIVVDKKRYEMARGFDVTYFPEDGTWDGKKDLAGDKVEVVLNEKGEAQWAFVYEYNQPDVIDEIDNNRVYGKLGGRIFETDGKKVQVIVRDNEFVELEDLNDGDLVYVVKDARNADHIVIAVSEVFEGELQESHKDWNNVTIDGSKVDVAKARIVSEDGGDTFNDDLNNDLFDETISYMLSPAGRIAVVISGSVSSNLVGVVEYVDTTARGGEVRILMPDNKKMVYSVETDYFRSNDFPFERNADTPFVLVEYSLDKAGRIDEFTAIAKDAAFDDYDGKRAKVSVVGTNDARWYRVDANAGFFGEEAATAKASGKLVATDWDVFKKYSKHAGKKDIQVLITKGSIKGMYVEDTLVDVGNIGVIARSGRDGGRGLFVEVFVDGERIRYNFTSLLQDSIDMDDYKNGVPVSFNLSSGKISEIGLLDSNAQSYVNSGVVAERGSNYLKMINNGNSYFYYMDEDTMIVDATTSTPKLTSRVGRGDVVQLYTEDKGVVELVVIVKDEGKTKDPKTDGSGGEVTYINADGMLLIDGEDYQVGAATVLYNEKGTVIAVGATAIEKALAQNDEVKDVKVENGVVKSLVGTKVASETAAAAPVIAAITGLATSGDLPNDVPAARALYNALTNSQKDLVTNYADLTAAEAALNAAAALLDAQTDVAALFTDANKDTLAGGVDQDAIDAASAKVEALPADVAPATDKADLQADIVTAQGLLDAKLAGAVDTLIEAGLATYDKVEAARAAYDALTDDQQELVKAANVTALTTAETAVANAVKAVNEATNYSGLKAALTTHATILDITVPTDDLEIIDLFNMLPFADAEAIHDAVTNL